MSSLTSLDSAYRCVFRTRVPFSLAEDASLRAAVEIHGVFDWQTIADAIGSRNQRQCKERWFNYLSPDLKSGGWTHDEDQLLRTKVQEIGNKWVKIAKFFPYRTDSMIKNRYNQLQRKEQKNSRRSNPEELLNLARNARQVIPTLPDIALMSPQILRDNERLFPSSSFVTDDSATLWESNGTNDGLSSYSYADRL
jgi:hypothetical protein